MPVPFEPEESRETLILRMMPTFPGFTFAGFGEYSGQIDAIRFIPTSDIDESCFDELSLGGARLHLLTATTLEGGPLFVLRDYSMFSLKFDTINRKRYYAYYRYSSPTELLLFP